MSDSSEAERVKDVYRRRDEKSLDAYTWLAKDIHSSIFSIDYAMSVVLKDIGLVNLEEARILDVGCGRGRWLRVLNEWGASGNNLYGTEINPERLQVARARSPHINYGLNTTDSFPFSDTKFDLVTVKTVFSSILDQDLRSGLAKHIQSICLSGGAIVVFDFFISSPRNKDTIGIGMAEMKNLFPGYKIKYKSVLLAPPLMRILCRLSPSIAIFAEWMLPFLRTHRIYILSKEIK